MPGRDISERIAPATTSPLAAGLVLLCAGAVISQLRPEMLSLPQPTDSDLTPGDRWDAGDRTGASAQRLRDGLLWLLPTNLFAWIGSGLMILGASVATARLLDLAVRDEDMTR